MLDINQNIEQCFSLYKKKTLWNPSFQAHDRRIWGSSHGWLITIDPNFSIQLLNPITRVKINLPPVATFGEPNDILKIGWFNLVHNAAVLKLGNNIFVTVIYGPSYNLAFVKLGDMAWTNVRSRLIFTSVACYKGMIFGLSVNGTLATVEIDENKQNPPIARCLVSLPMGEMCGQKLYLSEASDDLLLVCYHPKRMSVYRCDFISWEWKNVESLGGRVLFLDEHSCLSMCSRVCTKNLEADCIYYSDDNFQSWTDIDNFQSWTDINNYICVYNLKSKNWKTFFLGACVFFRYRSPTWLFPSPRLEIFDRNEFAKWVEKGMAPPLIPSLKLYEEVMKLGFKVFLLTGRSEDHKDITVENLINAGFKDWDKLILRASEDHGKSATLFKSEKRTEMVIDGYRILGNSGDQWSDLLGYSMSVRSFKLPNPMYYIP